MIVFLLQGFGDGNHRLLPTPDEKTGDGEDFSVFGAEAKIEFLVGSADLTSADSVLVGLQPSGPRNSFMA